LRAIIGASSPSLRGLPIPYSFTTSSLVFPDGSTIFEVSPRAIAT
jgi:hypothetical protein